MSDLLVNLLKLPPAAPTAGKLEAFGVTIKRAQPFELTPVRSFVEENFSRAWADEISIGFANKPVSIYLAINERRIVGFAAYECTRRAFFGPTGVLPSWRRQGVGKSLLVCCLLALRELGYVYGIIGGVGPVEFYQRTVDAIVIPDSTPGIYTNLLK